MRALVLAACAACSGQVGTIQLELTTAPGSTILDGVQHLRVTLTAPHAVVEADRTPSGFDLALDLDATGAAGSLIVEGFDANGSLVAAGRSPPFPVAAISAKIVIYMAAPLSIGGSPSRLASPRSGVAVAALTYGIVIAGGQDATNAKTDAIFIYNSYDHSLLAGMAMPAPRALQSVGVGTNNVVYLFGGVGADDVPTGTFWRFDSSVPPTGSYTILSEDTALARSATSTIQLDTDRFVITGSPPLDLQFNAVTARTDVVSLSTNAASLVIGGTPIALFAGSPIQRVRDNTFDTLAVSAEATAIAAPLPNGRIVFAGPGTPATRDLLVIAADSGEATRMPELLSSVRQNAAVAATAQFLVVAGGTDLTGAAVATADIFDATTLAPIATVPCSARSGASAFAMPNQQIAIVGGVPASDEIELFTPPPE